MEPKRGNGEEYHRSNKLSGGEFTCEGRSTGEDASCAACSTIKSALQYKDKAGRIAVMH